MTGNLSNAAEGPDDLRSLVAILREQLAAANERWAREIAEREQALEEARRAQAQAEAASQAKSTFLAHLSHELRTPLNGILGYAHILRQQPQDKSTLDGLLVIQHSGEHLLMLINDILDLSKIEAGKFELTTEVVDLPAFLDSIVEMIRSRAEAKQLTLSYVLPPTLPRSVRLDEKCLRQVLLNLLGNAVKFTYEGRISLTVEDRGYDQPGDGPAQIRLRFTVTDTGIGIAPDQLEQIFAPFVRVTAAGRRSEGTGLGLAISRQLVELLGGQLQVTSRPGHGSSFWFDIALPVGAEASASSGAPEREIVGYQGERRSVLVVDDHGDNRLVLQELLEPLGFAVRTASTGEQAIEQALAWQPDVILMDVVMPRMSGLVATQELRARGQTMIIIAVSASVLEGEIQETLRAGCDAFVAKPIDPDLLLTTLCNQLKLTWIYAGELQGAGAALAPEAILLPPRADLEALYRQAEEGFLLAVYAQVTRLAERDPRYASFAAEIGDPARAYEDDKVRALLRAYLDDDA